MFYSMNKTLELSMLKRLQKHDAERIHRKYCMILPCSLFHPYPLSNSLLLGFMNEEDAPLWKGYFYATLMFLLSCLQSLFNHQYMYTCFTVGMRVKTAVMGLVYRKVRRRANQ